MTDFLVYDVFADRVFAGNQLAVIPDARGLSEAQLPVIAREFNFSETTFIFPPDEPSHTARVRIFTPASELPFAGHPIVGTAVALSDLGQAGSEMVLELGVGPIPVTVSGNHARFVTRIPLAAETGPLPEAVAACIGLTADAIRSDRHAPVLAGLGTNFVLAELADESALANARPDTEAFRKIAGSASDDLAMLYVYLRDGDTIRARMFGPLAGVPEDPATGGAAAALAAWLGRLDGRSARFAIAQGIEMGRPSRIEAVVTVEDGAPVAVAIAGTAVKVMEGRLTL